MNSDVHPHLLRARISPAIRDAIITNREKAGHQHVMSAFRDNVGPSPRAAMGILWHLDIDTRTLTVQSTVPPVSPGILGDVLLESISIPPRQHERTRLRVLINCQKTPPAAIPPELRAMLEEQKRERRESLRHQGQTSALEVEPGQGLSYRSRMVIVPEDERTAWAQRRLAAIGFETDESEIQIGRLTSARLGKRGRSIPAVELDASGGVVDSDLFAAALRNGTGKGKNYGLALIRLPDPDPNPNPESTTG